MIIFKLFFLVTLCFSFHLLGKGREGKALPYRLVSPENAIEISRKILGEVNSGSRVISDANCSSVTLNQMPSYFEVSVDSTKDFYIIKEKVDLNNHLYNASTCKLKVENHIGRLECQSYSVSSLLNVEENKTEKFVISYTVSNPKKLLECPNTNITL